MVSEGQLDLPERVWGREEHTVEFLAAALLEEGREVAIYELSQLGFFDVWEREVVVLFQLPGPLKFWMIDGFCIGEREK